MQTRRQGGVCAGLPPSAGRALDELVSDRPAPRALSHPYASHRRAEGPPERLASGAAPGKASVPRPPRQAPQQRSPRRRSPIGKGHPLSPSAAQRCCFTVPSQAQLALEGRGRRAPPRAAHASSQCAHLTRPSMNPFVTIRRRLAVRIAGALESTFMSPARVVPRWPSRRHARRAGESSSTAKAVIYWALPGDYGSAPFAEIWPSSSLLRPTELHRPSRLPHTASWPARAWAAPGVSGQRKAHWDFARLAVAEVDGGGRRTARAIAMAAGSPSAAALPTALAAAGAVAAGHLNQPQRGTSAVLQALRARRWCDLRSQAHKGRPGVADS